MGRWSVMAEAFGAVVFLAAVGLISFVVWKIGTRWRRSDRLIQAIIDDTLADPQSDRMWDDFDRSEAGR